MGVRDGVPSSLPPQPGGRWSWGLEHWQLVSPAWWSQGCCISNKAPGFPQKPPEQVSKEKGFFLI